MGGLPGLGDWEAIYQDQPGGTWGPIFMNVGHPCGHDVKMNSVKPLTSQITVVIPGNNADSQIIDYPLLDGNYSFPTLASGLKVMGPANPDGQGNNWGISTVQAEGIATLPRTYHFYAEQDPQYENAPRAITWVGDGIPRNAVGQVVFWVQLQEIAATSCVTDVQYFFAAAQFCPKSAEPGALRRQAWLLEATQEWTGETLGGGSEGWAPYIRVKRDLTAKPLPASCGGKGQVISVYPTKASIDSYLKPVKEPKKFTARQITVKEWEN